MSTSNNEQDRDNEVAAEDLPDNFTVESIVSGYWVDKSNAEKSSSAIVDDDEPRVEEGANTLQEAPEKGSLRLLDDDEAWLKGDDLVLSEDDDAAFIKQLENTVSWRIEGMYNKKGKTHNQLYLRENPPLLIVESSSGKYASFVLSKDMVRTMSTGLDDLKKAYYGSGRHRGEARTLDEKARAVPGWAKDNPIKAAVTALLILSMIVLMVVL